MRRSLFYIVLAIGLTYLSRELLYAGLRRNSTGEFAKLRETFLDSTYYNTLILGSSRAESQYHPAVLDSIAGTRSYNAGLLGATMPFIDAAFEAWLEKHRPPQTVILNIDYHFLTDNPDTIHQFPRYFAYFGNETMYERFSARDPRFRVARYVPFYSLPYTNARYLNNAVRGWLDLKIATDSLDYRGFSPMGEEAGGYALTDTLSVKPYRGKAPQAVTDHLDSLVERCRRLQIRLVLVISPLHQSLKRALLNENELVAGYAALARQKQLTLLDYSNDPLSRNAAYYTDMHHLNYKGALLFSRRLGHDLDSLLH